MSPEPRQGTADDAEVTRLAEDILAALREGPKHFVEVLARFRAHEYRVFLLAWSRVREQHRLERDKVGRYLPTVAEKAGEG